MHIYMPLQLSIPRRKRCLTSHVSITGGRWLILRQGLQALRQLTCYRLGCSRHVPVAYLLSSTWATTYVSSGIQRFFCALEVQYLSKTPANTLVSATLAASSVRMLPTQASTGSTERPEILRRLVFYRLSSGSRLVPAY